MLSTLKSKVLTPKNLHKYSPYLFFMEMFSVWYFAIVEIIPRMYTNSSHHVIYMHQLFICFMGVEMLVNWFCIHFVDSGYYPDLHGYQQDSQKNNEARVKERTHENSQLTKRNTGSRLNTDDLQSTTKKYPYWSWVPCNYCARPRPPRCHHCSLCNRCVLKRDHHCYFARNCVGYKNWRYFAVFLFWAFLGCTYSFVHLGGYLFKERLPDSGYIDIIPFVGLLRYVFGNGSAISGFLVILWWGLAYLEILSLGHILETCDLIITGKTKFEVNNDIEVIDSRATERKIRATFGKHWILNLFMPLHLVFKAEEDPVNWPTISGLKKNVLLQIATVRPAKD